MDEQVFLEVSDVFHCPGFLFSGGRSGHCRSSYAPHSGEQTYEDEEIKEDGFRKRGTQKIARMY